MDNKHRVKLQIYDQTILLRANSPDEVHKLARAVDERMREFALQDDRISVTQLAILASLSFAREAEETRQTQAELERRIRIIEQKLSQTETVDSGQPRH